MIPDLSYPPNKFTQRDFFVPGAPSLAESMDAWRVFSKDSVGPITDRKVQRLVYRHDGDMHVSEVGYLEHDGTGEWLVPAIFEPSVPDAPWSICIIQLRNGTVSSREVPIMVSQSDVIEAFDFAVPREQADSGISGS